MKLSLTILALGLACATAQAEIGLNDLENLNQQAPPKRRQQPAPVAPTTPPKPVVPLPVSPPRPGPKEGILRFRNGDTLHGLLVNITNAGQCEWRHPDSKEPLHFSTQNTIQMNLPGGGVPPTGNAVILLSNGDSLRGDVELLDDNNLTLNTAYAGVLKIKRTMIRAIAPRRATESIVMDGLTSMDGWKKMNGAENWQLRNGVLNVSQQGIIGRDVILPDRSAVEFDMTWQNFPSIQIGLYTSQPEVAPGNGTSGGYWINLMSGTALFQRMRPNDFTQLGQVEVRRFTRNGSGRIGIFVDKAKKSFSLTLDGQLLRSWTDSDDFAGTGTCLILSAQGGGNHTMQLSNMIIRQWNGELSENIAFSGKTDMLSLANNDRVSGQVKSIQQGKVSVMSAVAPLEIPLERVTELYFSNENSERARRLAADVVAVFHDGGRVTVALDELTEKSLNGHSENFGKVAFDRDSFRELQFHIYDEDRGQSAEPEVSSTTPQPAGGLFMNGNGNGIFINNGGQIILRQGGQIQFNPQ